MATLHVIFNPLFLACLMRSTELLQEIVGMCSLPPVYSRIFKSLLICISSQIAGIPLIP